MVAPNLNAVREAALKLSKKERELLAEELLASVDPAEQTEIDAAWEEEIARRVDAYDRGELKSIDGEPILRALKEGRCP